MGIDEAYVDYFVSSVIPYPLFAVLETFERFFLYDTHLARRALFFLSCFFRQAKSQEPPIN
jgi:hypothetical protein